jgi:hypothetical protein
LPFLRFTRDKRGYETTALVYAGRKHGRSRPRLLYWFRTPPGVKVGRAPLDEHAIRWIEEQNPDITFDWPKILEAKAPAAPPPEDARFRRARRPAPERRTPAARQPEPDPATNIVTGSDPVPDEPEISAVSAEAPIDPEHLIRLRARYAEILARITERAEDAERAAALRAQAEALNPDAWVTADEIRAGVEAFERRIQDLRAALGLHRRRRSRRGGRRRRAASGDAPPAESPADPSNQSQD